MSTELQPVESTNAISKVDVGDFEAAFDDYLRLQKAIDKRMPDQIQKIGHKMFRKKGYWRAVAKGFRVSLKLEKEEFFEHNDEWGYRVIYVARDPNGVEATGDGTCTYSEKSVGRMEATHHNVCSHAHTRAQNRAISNLVGFGEVSADELPANPEKGRNTESGEWDGSALVKFGKYKGTAWGELPEDYLKWIVENMDPPAKDMAEKESERRMGGADVIEGEIVTNGETGPTEKNTITKSQANKLWKKAMDRAEETGATREQIMRDVLAGLELEGTAEIPAKEFDRVFGMINEWDPTFEVPEGEEF